MRSPKIGGFAVGVLFVLLLWIVGILASLAVPALAIWALLHFAFGVV